MKTVGLIHIKCDCEAELFYLGNTPEGTLRNPYVDRFLSQLRPGRYGVFSSADGEVGECPHCGLLIELPDPELVDWLPYTDPGTFGSVVEMLQVAESQNQQRDMQTIRAQWGHE